jgi:hypothetical protein
MAKTKNDGYGNYTADADELDKAIGSLPLIRGVWFFVDPKDGANTNDGKSPSGAVADIKTAYDLCESGRGDGIVVYSAGTTAANTSSYLTAVLDWSKHGITVLGIASGSWVYGRARIANAAATTNIANLVTVSGSNNFFKNIAMFNGGSNVASVGCLKVTGHRNHFENCHFVGAGHATPAAAVGAYDVLVDGGQDNSFEKCVLGTDTIVRAAANGNVLFDGGAWRTKFTDCDIVAYSETAGKGAIKSADADAISGFHVFSRCRFTAWKPNGLGALTSAFIGTKPTSGQILIDSCTLAGWAAWDSVGGNDTLYIANSDATASGAGGIATAV